MIHQKLIEILECLEPKSLERLKMFLASPYFNNGYNAGQITDLYEFLSEPNQLIQIASIDKKELNVRFFPNHEYRPKQKNPIDALASDLFKLVKEFICVEMARDDNYASKQFLYLARFYLKNNLSYRFEQTISSFTKYQDNRKDIGPWFYLDNLLIEFEVALFQSIFNKYTEDINLVSTHKSLDQFYKVVKLEFTAALKFQKQLGLIDDEGIVEKSYAFFSNDDNKADENFLIGFYQTIIDWLDIPPGLDEIRSFSESVLANRNRMELHTLRNLMAYQRKFYYQAYCKEVDPDFDFKERFDLYRLHLEEGFFDINNKILPVSLLSIIAIATKCDEIEWAKKILKDYPPERITGTNFAEEAHRLCEAEVLFANNEFDLAIEKLVYRNFENINYSIVVDTLLIKIYYMTDDELIYNRIRAMEQKVRRSKVADNRQASFLNFLKILNQVLKYRHDKESNKWIKIQPKLDGMKIVAYRSWLQQIIRE